MQCKAIAVTGIIGGGKSTVGKILAANGAKVLDADIISRRLQEIGGAVYEGIKKEFGQDYFDSNGQLIRSALARLVFNDSGALKRLNGIAHPIINAEIVRCAEAEGDGVFVQIPLLIECGLCSQFSEVWVVTAQEEVAKQRIISRGSLTQEEALSRIASQMPDSEKIARIKELGIPCKVIYNNGTLEELTQKVLSLMIDRSNVSS